MKVSKLDSAEILKLFAIGVDKKEASRRVQSIFVSKDCSFWGHQMRVFIQPDCPMILQVLLPLHVELQTAANTSTLPRCRKAGLVYFFFSFFITISPGVLMPVWLLLQRCTSTHISRLYSRIPLKRYLSTYSSTPDIHN